MKKLMTVFFLVSLLGVAAQSDSSRRQYRIVDSLHFFEVVEHLKKDTTLNFRVSHVEYMDLSHKFLIKFLDHIARNVPIPTDSLFGGWGYSVWASPNVVAKSYDGPIYLWIEEVDSMIGLGNFLSISIIYGFFDLRELE